MVDLIPSAHFADLSVHPKMVTQHMATNPLHHALGQTAIHHPRKRHRETGIADDILHPGPKAQHGFGAGIGRKV